ncbi:ATP-dependent DNA ligase LigD polymerase module,ATP-dependent DNA ligase LigD phosphoesterase module [Desulfocurvibacter africanus PCS]|uniref:DNA ligase (ATP) n=1 Tax=Desulfocurvibacter africanus PCS TaxID=1262666 RepID=M5PQJ6_DESAF|nr:DNA ligase D [Desulfocurvibacter africanus]EMG36295.1 ATP-dependent DNA ligase LigD polymerase module,ATP-dependent DNA ligase LigD phosphoesterase module [Desulfocurvibacter africanus PCS]
MARLSEYWRKRDFSRTPEPSGRGPEPESGRRFVIHKHKARRLHYDLRLELDGVLLSWAVPRGPSLDPGQKRLAVRVEDHPVEYGSFEGVIPQGEYGGGTVMLWDRGVWEPEGDPHEGLRQGKLHFRLRGEKLSGGWILAHMSGKRAKQNDWLLIKVRDEQANPRLDIETDRPESAVTGRTLAQIASSADRVWSGAGERASGTESRRDVRDREQTEAEAEGVTIGTLDGDVRARIAGNVGPAPPAAVEYADTQPLPPPAQRQARPETLTKKNKTAESPRTPSLPDFAAMPGARPGPMPEQIRPQLATLVDAPPAGEQWLHEIKFDGYRLLLIIDNGKARLMTRGGQDWTHRFPELARAAGGLPLRRALLDGEAVVLDERGRPDFQALQNVLKGLSGGTLAMYLFDMPYAEGQDLSGCALIERKEALRSVLGSIGQTPSPLRFSDHIVGKGKLVLENACQMGLEGIVSKRADAHYEPRRAPTWLKSKCGQRQEVVVAGWTDPKGQRTGFGALLVGVHDRQGRLIYAGKVGTGYDTQVLGDLSGRLAGLATDDAAFADTHRVGSLADVHWVRPELVAEVDFAGWTRDGIMRHPSFKGLREDKPPTEVVRENPMEPKADKLMRKQSVPAKTGRTKGSVKLTHPRKVLVPYTGLTKAGLADYYREVAGFMLPHVVGRPLSLVRCPGGLDEGCFFQRHPAGGVPHGVQGVQVSEKGHERTWLSVSDLDGLLALVQLGVLEIHCWGARNEDLERPDRLVFDLDPGEDVEPASVTAAVLELREFLEGLGLTGFAKATGGKGFHIVLPLQRKPGWQELREFARAVAEELAVRKPGEFVSVAGKARRSGRIYIDWLRNARGASSIAPYSTRARPGAPVAVPLTWEELTAGFEPNSFDVQAVRSRVASLQADPWEGFFGLRQGLSASMWRALGRKRPVE